MNSQNTSIITSVVVWVLGAATASLVEKGVLTSDQAAALIPEIVTVIIGIVSIGVIWWKKQQHTPTALTLAVNSGSVPGVKVVRGTSPETPVIVTPAGMIVPVVVVPKK